MLNNLLIYVALVGCQTVGLQAGEPVETPRPIPATRVEMKQLLEDMKRRPYRIPLPEPSDLEREQLGEQIMSYESRLRFNYLPSGEGTVFGRGSRGTVSSTASSQSSGQRNRSFTRNADENMTLTYQFKTMLFWIVARTNNCQYCLGHQEWKLSATGMSDDDLAALDTEWSLFSHAEQSAFAYARLLTYEPHLISDKQLKNVEKYYKPLQILEMTMSIAGNNAINRWKEGIGIPQSSDNTFANRGREKAAGQHNSSTFLTGTSERYARRQSIVAPLEVVGGDPSGRGISTRPALESRAEVLEMLEEASRRIPRFPLEQKDVTADWLKQNGQDLPVSDWVRLIAVFPNEASRRLSGLVALEKSSGRLSELQKAQLCWIIARQDRAWYAVGRALQKLKALGQTEDQIFALDGDWSEFDPADKAIFRFARNLAASPIAATDEDAAAALQETDPETVVQIVNHVASCAYFNRVTESAGLAVGQ